MIASHAMAIQTDFYIVAHADDWQLFMGDRAYADVQANHRVVFVQLGAASDGRWAKWEDGNQLSIESLAGGNGVTLAAEHCSWTTINGHPICKRSYKNTVSYYLRLPVATHDTGEGFPISNYQTLERLHLGIRTIDSLGKEETDELTSYDSFADLVSTLDSIVQIEMNSSETSVPTINAQDPDPEINRDDHKDHLTVGCAASIIASNAGAPLNLYVDYHSRNFPENLNQESVNLKTRLFDIFDSKVGIGMNDYFAAWLRRTIVRTITQYPITEDLLLYTVGQGIGRYRSLLSGCEKNYRDWRRSWRLLASGNFSGREKAEVFLYDPAAGEANVVSTRDKYVQITHTGLRKNWSSIVPIRRSGKDHLLFYSRETGDAELWDLSSDQMNLIQPFQSLRQTWKFILAGNFTTEEADSQDTSELLFYDDTTGESEIRRISDNSMSYVQTYTGWSTTWSAAIAGDFAGDSNDDIILYDNSTGEANLLISRPGQPFLQLTYSGWRKSSRLLTAVQYGQTKRSVLVHDPTTSELEIWHFSDSRQLLAQYKLRDSWDRVLSGRFGGLTCSE
jgi:hypothetical protein